MTHIEIARTLEEENPDALFADGFEDALIGIARQFTKACALYDRDECIRILILRDAMSEEEAEEFFEFNVAGAYMGEYTPVFASLFR